MENKLNVLIGGFLLGNDYDFVLITEKFRPLIKKYVRHLYKDDKEDSESELILSLLEAVYKIKYYEEEGQCVMFLSNALRLKYFELYKKSRRQFDHEVCLDHEGEINLISIQKEFDEFTWMEDCKKYLSGYSVRQREILYPLLFEGKSDAEVAEKFNVSRQYTNRLRKKISMELKCDYYKQENTVI